MPGFTGPSAKPTYTTAYLFTNNNKLFLIEYVYDGSGVNSEWENFMNKTIDSINFTR